MHLDGELFGGRKKFQTTVSIVKTPEHPKWNTISYCVSFLLCFILTGTSQNYKFSV